MANAFFSYSDNYLIDTDHGVIVDVEATRSIRQAEVGSTKTMLDRVKARFDLHPERLIADTAYGTGPMLGWRVDRKIAPHIPVFDRFGRSDGTWTRADFEWDAENDQYICPEGHELRQFRRNHSDPNRGPTGKGTARYRALKEVCQACPSKAQCCPNADARKITREEHEDARQVARDIAKTEQYVISMKLRKKVEMLFAHLKRILGLGRLRLRGPAARTTNSSSPPPPGTSGNRRRSFPHRSKREKPDGKAARAAFGTANSALANVRFSTESAEDGHCTIAAPILPGSRQQHGYAHSGLTFAVGDSAAGYAALTVMPEDREVLTVEMKINLIAPASGVRLVAQGRVVKAGRRLVVVAAEVHAEDGDARRLVAMLQGTMIPT